MTVLEFEAWISDNYDKLHALYLTGSAKREQNAQDALHNAIEGVLESGLETINARMKSEPDFDLFIWFSNHIRGYLGNLRDSQKAQAERIDKFGESFAALGEDAYLDTAHQSKRRRDRRDYLVKTQALESSIRLMGQASQEVMAGHWLYGQIGDSRWRYQTLRDNRLFDERAIRSLADSMHRASRRHLYFNEAGHSHLGWGTEDLSTSRPKDRAVGKKILADRRQEMAR